MKRRALIVKIKYASCQIQKVQVFFFHNCHLPTNHVQVYRQKNVFTVSVGREMSAQMLV